MSESRSSELDQYDIGERLKQIRREERREFSTARTVHIEMIPMGIAPRGVAGMIRLPDGRMGTGQICVDCAPGRACRCYGKAPTHWGVLPRDWS